MNLGAIRTIVRAFLSEPSASYWSDTELNTYINQGLHDFCLQTQCLEGIKTLSQVKYQADYTLPTDYLAIKRCELTKGNSNYTLFKEDLDEHFTGIVKTTSSPPCSANIWGGSLRLRERPSVAAASTTLSAAISTTTATTVSLTDSSSFPRMGRIIVDSEVIHYWNNASNSLTVCERGMEGTTAATHSNAATVTLRDIWIYFIQDDNDLSGDTDSPAISTQFHQALAHYGAWIGRIKSKDFDLAQQQRGYYDEFLVKGRDWAKLKWKRHYTPK